MRSFSFIALVPALACLLAISPLQAEDWTTTDGKVYPDIQLIKAEPDAVTILYRDGGALIPMERLPADLQKRFNYDPVQAQVAAAARARADAISAQLLLAEIRLAETMKQAKTLLANAAVATSVTPTGPIESASASPATSPDPTHHTIGELFDPSRSLQDSVSWENHYSMGGLARAASILAAPPDPTHHSMGSLFGAGDPLNQ